MAIIANLYTRPQVLYGNGSFYAGYAPGASPLGRGSNQPQRPATSIRIYDKAGRLKAVLSTNIGRCTIVSCSFELLDTGCGSFSLALTEPPEGGLAHQDRVDIHLMNESRPWYSGYVQNPGMAQSTSRTFECKGHGAFTLLDYVHVTANFNNQYTGNNQSFDSQVAQQTNLVQTVGYIAGLLTQRIQALTQGRIVYNPDKIEGSAGQLGSYHGKGGFYVPVNMRYLRTKAKDAAADLAALAGGYRYGVDEDREFFLQPQDLSVVANLWHDKHIEKYEPEEDSSKIVNRYWIQMGQVRTDITPGAFLFNTSWLEFPLDEAASQDAFGVREAVFTAPTVYNAIDAYQGAASKLATSKDAIQRCRLSGVPFPGYKIPGHGKVRITGKGGVQQLYPVKKVTYKLGPARISLDLELGDFAPDPADYVARLTREVAQQKITQQAQQTQLG